MLFIEKKAKEKAEIWRKLVFIIPYIAHNCRFEVHSEHSQQRFILHSNSATYLLWVFFYYNFDVKQDKEPTFDINNTLIFLSFRYLI